MEPKHTATERLAVGAADLGKLLGISERHVWSSHAAGLIPRPIRLGRATRWPVEELRAWLRAGSPSRDKWEASRLGGDQ